MSIRIGLLCALFTIACASKRERRQSVIRSSQIDTRSYHDSLWSVTQAGAVAMQLEELWVWNRPTDSLGQRTAPLREPTRAWIGKTVPTGEKYIRWRRFTLSADSKTISTKRFTDSTLHRAQQIEANDQSSQQRINTPSKYILWVGIVGLVLLWLYRLVRKVFL